MGVGTVSGKGRHNMPTTTTYPVKSQREIFNRAPGKTAQKEFGG